MSPTTAELTEALAALRAQAARGVLDTGRYRMRYFVWGSGLPIVFIHGMADAGEAFAMVMHRLASRFTCIAYELPDHTTDGSRLGAYSLAQYTADLVCLIDHLKLERVVVLGSSFGSLITLSSLAERPERITHGI